MFRHFPGFLLAASMTGAAAQDAVVPENWAAAPLYNEELIKRAVRDSLQEEKDRAAAASKAAAIPQRYTASSEPAVTRYERFATLFDEAKVPGCFSPDGLKRQPTFIFHSLLALPFIPIAYLRGKCN